MTSTTSDDSDARGSHHPAAPTSAYAARGTTLVELIVVIAIAGALLAIGVAGYVSFGRGLKITGLRNRIKAVVRHARNSTLYEGAPAGVFITEADTKNVTVELRDPPERLEGRVSSERGGTILFEVEGRSRTVEFPRSRLVGISKKRYVRAIGFRTVSQWHLEASDPTAGSFGRGCRIEHGSAAPGMVGGGIRLGEKKRAKSRIVAVAAPDDAADPYELPDGGRIELWARADPGGDSRGSWLVRRRGAYELRIAGGVLEGEVPAALARAGSYVLPANRWVKIALEFSPKYIRIYADDVPRAWAKGADLSPAKKQNLVFGEGFAGVLDEIRVQRRVEGDAVEIPSRFDVKGPRALFFDARGRLDPREHTAPVRYEVSRDGKSAAFTVTLGGMIEAEPEG